jgi:hypothetical protein
MDRQQLGAFLSRVATDPTYRSQLEADPVGTLAAEGVIVNPNDVPPGGIHLPTNQEILAARDAIVGVWCLHHLMKVLSWFRP